MCVCVCVCVWQEEVNSGRADLISIMYFALFILQQLKEEVDTMMSGRLEQRWVEELLAHKNTGTNSHLFRTVHLQCLQVRESGKAVSSYGFNPVVVQMPEKEESSQPCWFKYGSVTDTNNLPHLSRVLRL